MNEKKEMWKKISWNFLISLLLLLLRLLLVLLPMLLILTHCDEKEKNFEIIATDGISYHEIIRRYLLWVLWGRENLSILRNQMKWVVVRWMERWKKWLKKKRKALNPTEGKMMCKRKPENFFFKKKKEKEFTRYVNIYVENV